MARSAGAPGLARYARSQVSAIFARATSELIVNSTLPHERHTVLSMATDAFLPFPRGSWFMPYEPPLSRFVRRSSLPHFMHSAMPASPRHVGRSKRQKSSQFPDSNAITGPRPDKRVAHTRPPSVLG